MRSQFTIIGFAAGAIASPVEVRQDPWVGASTGFRLHVELITRDLPNPVAGTYVSLIEEQNSLLTSSADASSGIIFYTNGTQRQDTATYWAHEGIYVAGLRSVPEAPGFAERMHVSMGMQAEKGIYTTVHSEAPPFLVSEGHGWFFCPRESNGKKYNILERKPRAELIGPDDCVPVELQPVCAQLPAAAHGVVDPNEVQCLSRIYPGGN
ncbi:hypothetical protein PWT90_01950 [Aphanocladium album]|nr:hypothetical protein PWT90_01950 [Aphanocladium album]